MDRRNFIVRLGSIVLALPAASFLHACGGDDNTVSATGAAGGSATGGAGGSAAGAGGTSTAGAGGTSTAGAGGTGAPMTLTFISSTVQNHTHTFQITMTELASPPANGIDRETSQDAGHTHAVALSAGELQAIANGQTITKTTSLVSGHTHQFTFVKS